MQLTYVFSELGNGLKRNVSMTIAVIVTMFVSLTLVGLGLLLNAQATKAEQFWGDRLQITVFLCTDSSPGANCIDGAATAQQKQAVVKVLDSNPEVEKWHYESSRQAYDKWRAVYSADDTTSRQVIDAIKPSDLAESYWVTLKDPRKFEGVKSEVTGLPGVGTVRDLREVLQPIYFWISAFKWGAIVIAGFSEACGSWKTTCILRLMPRSSRSRRPRPRRSHLPRQPRRRRGPRPLPAIRPRPVTSPRRSCRTARCRRPTWTATSSSGRRTTRRRRRRSRMACRRAPCST